MIKTTGDLVNAKASLEHPMTDEVSIAMGQGAYCTFPYTVEIAFFKNGEWVYDILPEFASYHMDGVYGWVPLNIFAEFLENWREKN